MGKCRRSATCNAQQLSGSQQLQVLCLAHHPTAHPLPLSSTLYVGKWLILLGMHRVTADRLYRGLYILNWIYRYFTEKHYRQWLGEHSEPCMPRSDSAVPQHIRVLPSSLNNDPLMVICAVVCACTVWICGVVQTVIYCDFFYYYLLSWRNNEKLALPA